jgi:hypothetical protein
MNQQQAEQLIRELNRIGDKLDLICAALSFVTPRCPTPTRRSATAWPKARKKNEL